MCSSSVQLIIWATICIVCVVLTSSQNNDLQYQNVILEAICASRCLELYGEPQDYQPNKLYKIYTAKYCRSLQCKQCSTACKGISQRQFNDSCTDFCNMTGSIEVCQASCEFAKRHTTVKDINSKRGVIPQLHMSDPYSVCMYTDNSELATYPHASTVYLKWDIENRIPKKIPQMQFIISLRKASNSIWTHIGKTGSSFIPIRNLTLNTTYQFQVTSVSQHGLVDDPKISMPIRTLPAHYAPSPPTNVRINTQAYYKEAVSAKISWDANQDRSCFFKIFWLPTCRQNKGADYVEEEIKSTTIHIDGIPRRLLVLNENTPPNFVFWMNKLQFGCNYTVSIYSYPTDSFSGGSNVTKITFQTLDCLNATNYNYSVCKPEEPRNITLVQKEMYKLYGALRGNVTLQWKAPAHASTTNKVTGYLLKWSKEIPLHLGPVLDPDKGYKELHPNKTSYMISGMHWNNRYRIQLRARSPGGISARVPLTVDLGSVHYQDEITNSSLTIIDIPVEKRVLIGSAIAVSMVITIVAVLLVHYTSKKRRGIRAQRSLKTEETNPLYDNAYASNACDIPIILDEYEVDFSSIVLLKTLGEGAFGKVVKAEIFISGKDGRDDRKVIAAVKMLKDHPDAIERRNLLKEIEAMKQLGHHPNIVSIIGCCTENDRICLIMDYCPLGDLRQYLHRLRPQTQCRDIPRYRSEDSGIFSNGTDNNTEQDNQPITQAELLSYARQIAMGMEYLTNRKYVHRDLAARNILMFDTNRLKISDFGLTRDVYETNMYQPTSARRLPYKWMALEAMYDQIFTTKSDVWSFGIVLWEIVTLGGSPYPGIPNEDLFWLLKDGYRMENPGNCSTDIYQIMLSCWHPRPQCRPSFTDLRENLESMLEVTKAYINLSVSVSDDYYHSDSLSGKDEDDENSDTSKEHESDISSLETDRYVKNHIYSLRTGEADMPSVLNGSYHNVFVNERKDGLQHELCNSLCRFCNSTVTNRPTSKSFPERSSNLYEEPIRTQSTTKHFTVHKGK